jgi:hypothetical protein
MDYEFLIPGTAKAVIQNSKTNGSCVPQADDLLTSKMSNNLFQAALRA